ncbi:MAG: Trm112 family protein [Planctomycetaceae bacterium]
MTFDFESVRDVLCCPKSHSPLVQDGESLVCTSADCRMQYPVRDDIPILLLDEADELSETDWNDIIARAGSGGE